MSALYCLLNNNSNSTPNNICDNCNKAIINGIIDNGKNYCNSCMNPSESYDDLFGEFLMPKSIHRPSPPSRIPSVSVPSSVSSYIDVPSKPRTGGTCATCNNKYGYSHDSVDDGKNWFCDKSCQRVFSSRRIITTPGMPGLFMSNMMTVFPLKSGFTRTGYKIEY